MLLLPWLTRRLPVCGQHTEATARGASAQKHRSASLVGRSRIQRGTAATHIAASSKCCPGKTPCPYDELQPVESCPCNALNSPALCCLEGPRRHTSTAGDRSVDMHAPGAAPDAGLRAPPGALYQPHLIDVYYLNHAFPRQTNHQQRNPTSPPTTAMTAIEILAIAPEERLGSLPPAVLSFTSSRGQPVRQVDHSS